MYDKISKVTDISLVNDKISMYRKNRYLKCRYNTDILISAIYQRYFRCIDPPLFCIHPRTLNRGCWMSRLFRRTLLRYVRLMSSHIRLSDICDVHAPHSEVWPLRQYYFAPSNCLETPAVYVKIVERNSRHSGCIVQVKWKRVWNINILGPLSRIISETIQYMATVMTEDE